MRSSWSKTPRLRFVRDAAIEVCTSIPPRGDEVQPLLHARVVRHAEHRKGQRRRAFPVRSKAGQCEAHAARDALVVDEVATAAQLVGDTPMAVAGKLVLDALDESHPCGWLRTSPASPARSQDARGELNPVRGSRRPVAALKGVAASPFEIRHRHAWRKRPSLARRDEPGGAAAARRLRGPPSGHPVSPVAVPQAAAWTVAR